VIDVPQTREAPGDVVRALRALDPSAEVIYLGFGRWIVGKPRPTRDTYRIASRMLRTYWRMPAAAWASKRGVQRYHFALAALQGFRPVHEYRLRDLDSRVVRDFQESQWRMNHQRSDLIDEWEREEASAQEERRALLRDELRAKDVLDYHRTSNFGRATPSVQSSIPPPLPSGRTRHVIPA